LVEDVVRKTSTTTSKEQKEILSYQKLVSSQAPTQFKPQSATATEPKMQLELAALNAVHSNHYGN
jgi:hypothetical protein